MKHLLLFSLLLIPVCLFGQTDSSDSSKKIIQLFTCKIGYINSTNHWTQNNATITSSGYSNAYASFHNTEQTGHGIISEFEMKYNHFSIFFGLNLVFWHDSVHGSTRTQFYHPNAPQGYPIINHYSTSNSYYSAKSSELRARIGANYWVFTPEKRYNIGVGIAYNPRLYSKQHVQSQRTDYYYIYEVGPWMSDPGSKTETWGSSESTPVKTNQLASDYGGYNNRLEKWLKQLDLSFSVLARAKLVGNMSLESNFGYRFQDRSRIVYQNYQQDAGFFGQIMLGFEF